MEKTKDIKKEFKLVFNAGIARRLIRMGVPVADIKQDRDNADKTVFVFKNDANFRILINKKCLIQAHFIYYRIQRLKLR